MCDKRTHVVEAVGELDEDDPDVVDHRQQHLAEVLGLPLFARRKRNGADFGDPLDDVGDLGAEVLLNLLDRRQRVFDDVVQEARRQWRPDRAACRLGCWPPRAGEPGTARRNAGPALCAPRRRTHRPAEGTRVPRPRYRPSPARAGLRIESSNGCAPRPGQGCPEILSKGAAPAVQN